VESSGSGVQLKGEPPCQYTIISEDSDSRGNATTWAKGEDGYLYRCIQPFDSRRIWSRFPKESEPLRAGFFRKVVAAR
jgi:hypothetical protein